VRSDRGEFGDRRVAEDENQEGLVAEPGERAGRREEGADGGPTG
jgi:hypothetical protein